jgi:tetratricopeptide (TPR) repeat protein
MLLRAALPAEIRAAASLLQGEAAYHANDHATADSAYRRAIVELGQRPEVSLVRLSLGWVALRQGRRAEARKAFQEFAAAMPEHPNAPDAALLASEMALATDVEAGRRDLETLIGRYPTHPRTDFARLNRAIVWLRGGQHAEAVPVLRDWVTRAPFRPLVGRANAALGAALLATGRAPEAAKYFSAAGREGVGALASLGSASVALVEGRADDAARQFTEARDSGTVAEVAAAEYGLAAVGVQRGAVREFKQPARAALQAQPNGPMAARLLYLLTGIGVEEKDWPAALDAAKRLVTTFPTDEAGDDALARVGSAAAPERAWPVVYEAYSLMRQRYPASPFLESGRMLRAQAALETGRMDEARRELETVVQARPADAQAWVLLARAREGTGDRRGAIDAFSRASNDGGASITRDALLGHARLLVAERRWDQARAVYERLLTSDERDLAVDAAYSIGETYRGEGDQVAAAEYYMTAAYLAPESPTGRRAMLAAAQSFATAKHPDAAAAVYRKLLAQASVPPEVANAARQGLTALGR